MNFFDTTITSEARMRVLNCLDSRHLSEGKLVQEFEQKMEEVFGYKNGVAVNSGTAALHLALILADVGKDDEVIIPAQTFVATGLVVLYCGAKVVFADINKETGNISVDSVSKKITHKTRAVICVSWGGNPCDLYQLQELCDKKNIYLIQDNAQALGAKYNHHSVSDFGDFSCYSFQAIKQLTTGDGGLLVCGSETDALSAKDLRWFGISREDDIANETGERQYNLGRDESIGHKYHMNDYAAALGLGNLEGFSYRQERVRQIAAEYDYITLKYRVHRNHESANWLYTILVEKRDEFIRMMKSKDIPVSVVHVGIHRNDLFQNTDELPNQEYWDKHHICLPIHAHLLDEDVEKVVKAIRGGW